MRSSAESRLFGTCKRSGRCLEFRPDSKYKRYRNIMHLGKIWLAHRLAFHLRVGPIPDGMLVLHRCDNMKCVEPSHLFVGTHLDNNLDMLRKGRGRPQRGRMHWTRRLPGIVPRGENQGNSKLTLNDVQIVRHLSKNGVSQRKIAKVVGASQSTVFKIVHGLAWRTDHSASTILT